LCWVNFVTKRLIGNNNNNPGFDIFALEKAVDGRYLVFAIECRFSEPDSKTVLSLPEIQNKHKLLLEQGNFGKQLGVQIKKNDIYLVVIAWRKQQLQIAPATLPHNVLVLDRHFLTQFYACFATRPQFILKP